MWIITILEQCMKKYKILLHKETHTKCSAYLQKIQNGKSTGTYLRKQLQGQDISQLHVEKFLALLINTKPTQIFAESSVFGNGTDWNEDELSILGDISIAVPVTVYDNGKHYSPDIHEIPFSATLLFTPGALLRNGMGCTPADWREVTTDGDIDSAGYYQLYERRLLPALLYANEVVKNRGKKAFITIPGLGCGQFAGKFIGQLGTQLREALRKLLQRHRHSFTHIKAIYYDTFRECNNERSVIEGIDFLVRPLTMGNENKPQLCLPQKYEERGDDFADCELFSFVAWDHVSWPGNDFYAGARSTDDGVKAAATNTMEVMTGWQGDYDKRYNHYSPPSGYKNWRDVVVKNSIEIEVKDNLMVYP